MMKHVFKRACQRVCSVLTDNANNEAFPLQIYPGYEAGDSTLLEQYTPVTASTDATGYTDGFGVRTLYSSVPFVQPGSLNLQRLTMPLPDDGFHAEGIEYVAVCDALRRSRGNASFCAVEIGAGWGPWIGLAGILALRQGITELKLVGVEASASRFQLMQQHLVTNQLRPSATTAEDAQLGSSFTRLFNGAVWTHDGEIWFPEAAVDDMGAAASAHAEETDYRGTTLKHNAIPCRRLDTLLDGLGVIDFMHIDIQGAEADLLQDQIDWVNTHVRSLMVATHSRPIEGRLVELLFAHGWQLHREKPCRVDWGKNSSIVGKTLVDGSQYWLNPTDYHALSRNN